MTRAACLAWADWRADMARHWRSLGLTTIADECARCRNWWRAAADRLDTAPGGSPAKDDAGASQ